MWWLTAVASFSHGIAAKRRDDRCTPPPLVDDVRFVSNSPAVGGRGAAIGGTTGAKAEMALRPQEDPTAGAQLLLLELLLLHALELEALLFRAIKPLTKSGESMLDAFSSWRICRWGVAYLCAVVVADDPLTTPPPRFGESGGGASALVASIFFAAPPRHPKEPK